jgi:hypothetical protein
MQAMLVATVVLVSGATRAAPLDRPVKFAMRLGLPYVIGPPGHWTGQCPPQQPTISGCVTAYSFRPRGVDVTVRAYGLGPLGTVTALACQTTTLCPAASQAVRASTILSPAGSGSLFSPQLSLPSPAGISSICATASNFQLAPPGQPHTPPVQSTPLGCASIAPALATAAGAFKITPSAAGLEFEGWFIDLTTDAPARIVVGRGSSPSSTVTALANGTNAESRLRWPGYSDQHGFAALLPYVGAPGATQICAWLAASTGTSLGSPLRCFSYQEPTAAFAEAHVARGAPLQVSVRNVPSGAAVSVNLKADPGHFMLPWTNTAIWAATADQTGSVDFTIATDQLPPGQYVIAYHCTPECPGGNLNANQLIGGHPWTGSITFGPSVTIDPTVARGLLATMAAANKVRVVGSGFGAGESVSVIVVPPLLNFEGFPAEVAGIAYTAADAHGAFSVDVDVTGLQMSGPHNQVVALDSSRQPVAAASFTLP